MKDQIQQLYFDHKKKFRYLIAGIINTIVGLAIYPALYLTLNPIGIGYIGVLVVAQLLCVTFSFVSNKYFVFKTQGNLKSEYIKFFSFHGLYFAINIVALPALVEILNLNPMIAQTIFSIFIIVTSYFWHNAVTFKASKELL
jgi:putative flippase GtrA